MGKRTIAERQCLVRECRSSGKATKTWCKEKGIPHSTFRNWAATVPKEQTTKPTIQPIQWAALRPTEVKAQSTAAQTTSSITLSFRGGCEIVVEAGFDSKLLTAVLQVVSCVC